jgi:hypothetical protein
MSLTDALMSVGFKTNVSFITNLDLETHRNDVDRPRIKVVDWYYNTVAGSMLEDTTQIVLAS